MVGVLLSVNARDDADELDHTVVSRCRDDLAVIELNSGSALE